MASASNPPSNGPLTSWKEIAAFFGKEVRTVQKWEKEEGMPVHRHVHRRQSSVYAFPEELQNWWRERGAHLGSDPISPGGRRLRLWIAGSVAFLGLVLIVAIAWNFRSRIAGTATLPVFHTLALDGTRPGGNLFAGIAGDVNGDGTDDIVFSAPQAQEVYLLFGGKLPALGGELPLDANVLIVGRKRTCLWARRISDLNGDGIQDLLLSEYLQEPESWQATGLSYILWGRRQWPERLQLAEEADVTLRTDWPGYTAETTGCSGSRRRADLNHDGIEDLILGALEFHRPDERSTGALFVLFGRKNWAREVEVISSANVTIYGSQPGEALGSACTVGDFNGDGTADLRVDASESTLWNLQGSRGRAYIFLGRPKWPRELDAKTDFDFQVRADRPNRDWGWPLLADVNGDRRDDLVVSWSSRGADSDEPGAVRIWFGGQDRRGTVEAERADVVILGESPGAKFGMAVVAADLDGDGIEDLMISEPGVGRVYLLYGRSNWNRSGALSEFQPVTLMQGEAGSGSNEMTVGDWDGDAMVELALSAPGAGGGVRMRAGRAWVVEPYVLGRVEIRPQHDPNVVYHPSGLLVVRLHGDRNFFADPVEPASVRLAGVAAERNTLRDEGGDGYPDLTLYFDTTHLRVTPQTQRLALTGRTRSGLPVGGSDKVEIVIVQDPLGEPSKTGKSRPR